MVENQKAAQTFSFLKFPSTVQKSGADPRIHSSAATPGRPCGPCGSFLLYAGGLGSGSVHERCHQQLAPRPVRDELGDNYGRPSLSTAFQSGFALELTRGGWNNPMVLPRSTMQRTAYRIEDDALLGYHWNVLDRTLSNEPIVVTLLEGVESLRFRFFQPLLPLPGTAVGQVSMTEKQPSQADARKHTQSHPTGSRFHQSMSAIQSYDPHAASRSNGRLRRAEINPPKGPAF